MGKDIIASLKVETTIVKSVLINTWDPYIYPFRESGDLRYKNYKFVWLKLFKTVTNDEPPVYSWEGALYSDGTSGTRLGLSSETSHLYSQADFSSIDKFFEVLGWVNIENTKTY